MCVEEQMETEVDEVEGKATVFSHENPLYNNSMKLYQAERYDFQQSGEIVFTQHLHNTVPSLIWRCCNMYFRDEE